MGKLKHETNAGFERQKGYLS